MMRASDKLRIANQENWDAVVTHPFCSELAEGTLPLDKMRRYLAQDYCFIDNFVRLAASAIHHAPSLPDRLPLAHFLGVIAGPENTYFQRSFEALDVALIERENPTLLEPTESFQELMIKTAESGCYGSMVAVLSVAEWSYLSWASPFSRAAEALPFYFGEWIELHCGDYFESVVEHLRLQLDHCYTNADAAEKARIEVAFARTVELERSFFDTCYNS